jgi:acetyltransferase EpsM
MLAGMSAEDERQGTATSEQQPLVVLGTSLLSPEIADLATDAGFDVTGFIENRDRSRCEADFDGRPVHWIDDCGSLTATHLAVCGLGTTTRSAFTEQAAAVGFRFATIIHPTAHVSRTSMIGEGAIVGVQVAVASHTEIGRHVFLNRGSSVGHDTRIGDHVSVLPGAIIAGACVVGRAAYIAMGSIVTDRISIGEESVVGAGAVVVDDVPPNVQVMGIPAKIVKRGVQGR